MHKRHWKITIIFSALVFLILTITMLISVPLTVFLYKLGLWDSTYMELMIIVCALVTILLGTLISKFAGKQPLKAITQISIATQEITRGNYKVHLNEEVPVLEIHDMAQNFNIMAKELAGTEMLRSDFVENVSHEFKTPLSAIEGYATLLQSKSLPESKRLEYTEKILLSTKRLSSLTGNILLLSQLEHQETTIKKKNYCLDEQLRESILLFEKEWTDKNLELDINLDNTDYYGNENLLAHVWQNLLGNAIKFTEPEGIIRILLFKQTGIIKVSIIDTGIGMSPEVTRRVYEKFYQGDSSRSSQGNGLGLALAKRIVTLHDGSISVSSTEGTGTSFTVSLPVI